MQLWFQVALIAMVALNSRKLAADMDVSGAGGMELLTRVLGFVMHAMTSGGFLYMCGAFSEVIPY